MEKRIISLSTLSDISYEMVLWYDEQTQLDIVVLGFTGVYKIGSMGSGDGRFMAAIASAALKGWLPSGLIFDLRCLKYEYGNTILEALIVGYDQSSGWCTPTQIIVSDLSRAGVVNLLKFGKQNPVDLLSNTTEEAVKRVIELIHED